jgi:phosphopantothenoylcysteine decarboxylase/phosphopantothenate--cysteine ligase
MGPVHPADALRGARGAHLQGRVVGLGVLPGLAAPSAVRVARELLRLGADVQPLLGPGAEAWVHPDALHYASGRPCLAWDPPRLDALLLAPCSEAALRGLAWGFADSAPLQAAQALRGKAPVLAAGQGLGAEAAAEGVRVVHDAVDADGALRPGPLAAEVAGALSASPLRGRRVLLVAGSASEPWDAMRVVTASCEPGLARALALELRRRGARVTLLLGPAAHPRGRHERAYDSLRDLALMAPLLGAHDLLVLEDALPALAPVPQAGKLASGQPSLSLELHRAPPVAQELRGMARRALAYRSAPEGLLVGGEALPASGVDEQARVLAERAEALA